MASPRNGKRRGPAASSTGEGVAAVLAAALEMERTGSAELRPPAALTNDEALDAPATTNGVHWPSDAPVNGEPGTGATVPQNGADVSSLDSAAAQHRADRTLQGFIDEANATAIRGWAWDPKAPDERIRLEVVADDVPLLTVSAGENRPGLVLSGIGDGRHGFDIALAGGLLPEGRHVLHLRCAETGASVPGSPIAIEGPTGVAPADAETGEKAALDGRGAARNGAAEPAGETASAPSIRPVLESDHLREVAGKDDAPANFRAHLDEMSDTEISGWIMRRDEPSHRCVVVLKEGERVLARTMAARFRPDLAAAGVGDGCHAFSLAMPRSLLDGEEHLLEVIEQDTDFPLTAEPVRWRSMAGTGGAALARIPALADVALRPGTERPSSIETRAVHAGGRALSIITRRNKAGMQTVTDLTTRILFDVSDLVYYIGHHPNLTGIQRVQSSIVLATVKGDVVPTSTVIFLSFNARSKRWVAIPTGFLISLLEDLFLTEPQRLVSFSAEEARYGMLPGARDFDGVGTLDDGSRSVLCLLGAAWVQRDYFQRVLAFKRQFGTRFVMTVHDLIPIYARETCDQGTARVFEEFLRRALRHVDHVLSVSENTAKDLRRYVASLSRSAPPITVTQNGSSFDEFLSVGDAAGRNGLDELPDRYVLFVATVEGRKNHRLMLDIWRRMVEAGDDPPYLVCVGRLGWKSEGFLAELVETDYLNGKVILLQDISDADLRLLYSRCLFTVCPSLYEGWGLPVGESLAAGKICVCSDRASIPEVAGEFGVYIDIGNFEQSLETVRGLIIDPAARRKLEQKIHRNYDPIAWRSVAEKVVAACLAAPETEWQEPYPYAAIPYSTEISFAWLGRDIEGAFGDDLMARIADARRGHFLRDPLREENFLWGEDARGAGLWAEPENWGTWLCHSGGEIVLGLGPNSSQEYYLFLRLRASGPVSDLAMRLSANGEIVWHGSVGPRPKNIVIRMRRRTLGAGGWRLRLKAEADLSAELRQQIAAIDSRVPIIGFERLVVVPEDDLKTRLDILYTLLL
jgi:glycosyltransferase involved in cell wall biosynthesis